jgi:hypothetical protein
MFAGPCCRSYAHASGTWTLNVQISFAEVWRWCPIGLHDCSCLDAGADLYGDLPYCGIGEPMLPVGTSDLEWQKSNCRMHNQELFRALREDKNAEALHQITVGDFKMGRMSEPVPASQLDWDTVSGCFAVRVCACACRVWPCRYGWYRDLPLNKAQRKMGAASSVLSTT